MQVNRTWLGFGLLMLPTFLVALDTTALLLALPRLSAALGADNVEQLWISDSYGFIVAGRSHSCDRGQQSSRRAF
jgi:DHA2 family multidrug resistance protein-like MFS transporter